MAMAEVNSVIGDANSHLAQLDNVAWSIDADSSSDDESATTPIVNAIPRFDEADRAEEKVQKKFKETVHSDIVNNKVEQLMKKSVIGPGFEQLHSVPKSFVPKRVSRKLRKEEREKTKGPGWYNIPVQEATEEIKNDLDLLKMRAVLDPKHVYKKNDLNHTPKYFQVGRVLETPADFFNGRIPKSQRKRTLVDELLADAEARAYQKKKYKNIVDTSRRRKGRSTTGEKKSKNKKKK